MCRPRSCCRSLAFAFSFHANTGQSALACAKCFWQLSASLDRIRRFERNQHWFTRLQSALSLWIRGPATSCLRLLWRPPCSAGLDHQFLIAVGQSQRTYPVSPSLGPALDWRASPSVLPLPGGTLHTLSLSHRHSAQPLPVIGSKLKSAPRNCVFQFHTR